jgi:hypothetical protein
MTYPAPSCLISSSAGRKSLTGTICQSTFFRRGTHTTRSRMRPKAWGAWWTRWPPRCWFRSKSSSTKLASSSLDRRMESRLLLVVGTMSRGIRAQETEPTADRASERRKPGDMTACSPEEIVGHTAAAGRAAYAAVIRAGRAAAVAERAYHLVYMRTTPPCWVALVAHPTPPRLAP